MHGRCFIGTSGWNYADWRGRFYPPTLPARDWLRYLAERLDTVELNNSFYRIPTAEQFARWHEQTPARFRFAVKLWRGITHFRKLSDTLDSLGRFFDAANALPSAKRGPLLVQLPPSLGADLPRLDRFLGELRRVMRPARWRVAVEFRHDSWLIERTYRLLDRRGVALCLHDMPGRGAADDPNDVSFVYVRRHGPQGDYHGGYSDRQIASDARRIVGWLAEGRQTFVYFNNDVGGHAVADAFRLRERVAASLPG